MQLNKKRKSSSAQHHRAGSSNVSVAGSLMAAALALPGVVAAPAARAEAVPEKTSVGFKFLNYSENQETGKRMKVNSPSMYFLTPIKDIASVEGSFVLDSMSGASPTSYNTLSGASGKGIHDNRKAGDLKLTTFLDRAAIGVGIAGSKEHDYESNAFSLDGRLSTANNNTTFAGGIGYSGDKIGSSNDAKLHEKRRTTDALFGITQVLTPNDLIQSNITVSVGKGYFSDPYKDFDKRPDERTSWAWLTRYNHYFPGPGAALHTSYRYFKNDWGIAAHTIESAWYQPVGAGWLLRPSLRYYTQRAASFYRDPQSPPNPPLDIVGASTATHFSADTRLAAFGAVTLGMKVAKTFASDWTVDVKYEWYQQRSAWRLGGDGSPGLENFTAKWWQIGISKKF
jgi:Protein of unknown function (DUF3570)